MKNRKTYLACFTSPSPLGRVGLGLLFLICIPSFLISQNSLDQLEYNYYSNTNQLNYIKDAIGASAFDDLDDQSSGNYTYDANGQLIGDAAEGILNIEWTVAGKVKEVIYADRTIKFKYDAMGNRVKKNVTSSGVTVTTYYVCNAMGELISIYDDEGGVITRKEMEITDGSDHIADVSSVSTTEFERKVGAKNYELKDHLGNVRITVSDTKEPNSGLTTFTSQFTNSTDYYSYGMLMPGRDYNSSDYRWGYQRKEKDDELKGKGNSYDFGARLLDPRAGRWLSVDPLEVKFPSESPYNSMSNDPVNKIDPTGGVSLLVAGLDYACDGCISEALENTAFHNPRSAIISPDADIDKALWISSYTNVEVYMTDDFFSEGETFAESIEALKNDRETKNGPLYNSIVFRSHGGAGGVVLHNERIYATPVANIATLLELKKSMNFPKDAILWAKPEKEGDPIQILWHQDAEWAKAFKLLADNTTPDATIQFAACHTGQGSDGQIFLTAISMITNRRVEAPTGFQIGGLIPGISGDKYIVTPSSTGTSIEGVKGNLQLNAVTAPGGVIDRVFGPTKDVVVE